MSEKKLIKLSASAVKTYESCPRKYYYTYINKPDLPKKDWSHLQIGLFLHEVLEHFHNILMKDPSHEWPSLMSEMCKKTISKYKLTAEDKVAAKDMLAKYLARLSKDGLPDVISNEESFKIMISEDVLIRGFIDRIDSLGESDKRYNICDYKGLALDTKIPTPSGWSTMGDLKVGDEIYGTDGGITRVTAKSQIHHRLCFKITLSDKSEIIADNVHNWSVGYRENGSLDNYDKVMCTADMYKAMSGEIAGSFYIQNPAPIDGPEVDLPIDPWLLGAWLGDGISREKCNLPFSSVLREQGLLQNKHIPLKFLRSSLKQRLQLLRGLMDTDGSWNTQRSRAVFVSSRKELFDNVVELVRSLGVTAQTFKVTDKKGYVSYRLEFRPVDFNPFSLKRKAELVDRSMAGTYRTHQAKRRRIVSIEPVDSVPTQCITVDAENSLYLCGEEYIPTHNTGKSKYLDEFQLLVYGIHLLDKHPDVERFKASYLVLKEDKVMSYIFTKTDVDRIKNKLLAVADAIRNDKTWQTKPQFLCEYCDFNKICPDSPHKEASNDRREW